VALSIVGTDRTPDNGYFRAKVAQEKLIETSGIPYTIIRSTQFLEFLGGIAASSADGNIVRFRPACSSPSRRTTLLLSLPMWRSPRRETASSRSPARNERRSTKSSPAIGDPREVVSDPEARYFGGRVEERSLVPLGKARLGRIGFDEWLRRSQAAA